VAAIPIYQTPILAEWIDYNGHLRDAYYTLIVSLATDALMDRVGLEDNLYLSRGVYASKAQLVEKARTIIEAMGARILTPAQTRERLKLS